MVCSILIDAHIDYLPVPLQHPWIKNTTGSHTFDVAHIEVDRPLSYHAVIFECKIQFRKL